jgi:acetylornithine/succinyldiaminopimelate/putrescine aminotransferase
MTAHTVPVSIEKLRTIREFGGLRKTLGIDDEAIERFLDLDPNLGRAIDAAAIRHEALRADHEADLASDETDLLENLQASFVNFYPPATVNPYVALAAAGPWIVTSHGAVIHDNGGYGMLGAGHGPVEIMEAMAGDWVMANVMTASFSQKRLAARLRAEIGHTRGECPYARFVCLNSGSESVTLASRISDTLAALETAEGARHAGRTLRFLGLVGGFHGRTSRPAQVSDSCLGAYRQHLASFRDRDNLLLVEPNDVPGLERVFRQAEADGIFIESFFMEPVMGEGNPGQGITREFYDAARRLTAGMGSLLVVDSIQAGLRAQGVLSLVDYPGFADAEAPDIETFSKALNAGQYPLSVVALGERAVELDVQGPYGNTMTTNPRALEVACAVLDGITPALRIQIVERGAELVRKLERLAEEFPGAILSVRGTGLLLAAELDPERLPVVGFGKVEEYCRVHGLGVIHGGVNALRFTPNFAITSEEIDLIVDIVRQALHQFLA